MTEPRRCDWCDDPLPADARATAVTCSKACRQARHRFRVSPAPAARGRAMRFAYADPPYPRLARKYYADDERCAEVDHRELVDQLVAEFPDGWALSTSARALAAVLRLCPDQARVSVWVKGSRRGASNRARNAYEPVILFGGRALRLDRQDILDDVLLWGGRQRSHPGALVGMKPAPFCEWLFRQLGARQGDTLVDLYPGSGAVSRAWSLHVGPVVNAGPEAPPRRSSLPSRMEQAAVAVDDAIDPQQRLRLGGR